MHFHGTKQLVIKRPPLVPRSRAIRAIVLAVEIYPFAGAVKASTGRRLCLMASDKADLPAARGQGRGEPRSGWKVSIGLQTASQLAGREGRAEPAPGCGCRERTGLVLTGNRGPSRADRLPLALWLFFRGQVRG